jgi:hypothetical protein
MSNQDWELSDVNSSASLRAGTQPEWLKAQPDRDATIVRYAKYGFLQKIQTEIAQKGPTTDAQRKPLGRRVPSKVRPSDDR